ncbi:MAG: hypothetical protein R3C56_11890 [Pirellulaceae bacterium]
MRHAKAAGQNEPTSNDVEHHSMNQSLGPRPQGDADSPKRILYDMSFTCLSGKISGIERVVRSLVTAGVAWQRANAHQSSSFAFIPVFANEGRFYELDERAQSLLAPPVEFERDCISSAPQWYRLIASMLCRTVPMPWLRRQLLPGGSPGDFQNMASSVEEELAGKYRSRPNPNRAQC